jgi:hypothetical protein
MQEIFRYQQLRPTQKLSEEQKLAVGMPLYPDQKLSELAKDLVKTESSEAYIAILNRYREKNRNELIINESQLNPTVRSVYEWFNFKAKPIKKDDYKQFIEALPTDKEFDLSKEWNRYADNFILAINDRSISFNFCVDFQLLIRILYILKLTTEYKNSKLRLLENFDAAVIAPILDLPILLPSRILRSRCSEDCSGKGKIDLPVAPENRYDDRNPCECKCNESCQKPNGHCICIKTYVGDLFIVKEEAARYEEGDIAHIENILAGESKVRRHKTFYRTEDTTETENETITNEERDHQSNEKFSLQEEVKRTVDSKVGVDAGVTATFKYGEAITVTPHANVTANFAKSQSENIARSYAKEIIDRSVSKIQEKMRKVQLSKIINELEERNKHSIDNTQQGAGHRAGMYYWVNKITHAQVFNYGKHMMFDMIVPEPAATFKKLYELKLKTDISKATPEKPDITPQQIARNTYGNLLKQFSISSTEELQPPADTTYVQVAISQNVPKPEDNKEMAFSSHEFKSPDIPKGYKAVSMDYDIRCSVGHPKSTGPFDEAAVSVNAGKSCLFTHYLNEWKDGGDQSNKDWVANGTVNLNGEEGNVSLSVAGFTTLSLSLSGTMSIKCQLTGEALEKWQTKIFNIIMTDYNRKLDAYNAGDKKDDQLIQIKGRNPFLNREIERNEFKRHIIAILMCNYFNGMGSMMEKVAPCGYPEINFEKLEKDAPIIQFFEQVLEWNYITYVFYHSMWARKCKWPELIDEDSGDPLFDKFLMSGAARVQVPIRPGMEEVFNWFLKTGQIWGATGIPPVSGDDEYVSMIQELKESKQCDYTDRPGLVQATNGNNVLKLTDSTFYWDLVNNTINQLAVDNDKDRELLIDYEVYRIVKVEQVAPNDPASWNITIDRPFEGTTAVNLKHAVGALFVGAPWEIVIPTKLVYLRNNNDKLPVYPLA